MSKRKYRVRAECPACACGDEKEIEILCPMCGTKHKGTVEEEEPE